MFFLSPIPTVSVLSYRLGSNVKQIIFCLYDTHTIGESGLYVLCGHLLGKS